MRLLVFFILLSQLCGCFNQSSENRSISEADQNLATSLAEDYFQHKAEGGNALSSEAFLNELFQYDQLVSSTGKQESFKLDSILDSACVLPIYRDRPVTHLEGRMLLSTTILDATECVNDRYIKGDSVLTVEKFEIHTVSRFQSELEFDVSDVPETVGELYRAIGARITYYDSVYVLSGTGYETSDVNTVFQWKEEFAKYVRPIKEDNSISYDWNDPSIQIDYFQVHTFNKDYEFQAPYKYTIATKISLGAAKGDLKSNSMSAEPPFYTNAKSSFIINNWSGEIHYQNDPTVVPTFTATNGLIQLEGEWGDLSLSKSIHDERQAPSVSRFDLPAYSF